MRERGTEKRGREERRERERGKEGEREKGGIASRALASYTAEAVQFLTSHMAP